MLGQLVAKRTARIPIHQEQNELAVLRDRVDKRIEELIGHIEPTKLREILTYASIGGKRIRPLLVLIACGSVGGRTEDAVSAAAAVELLHTSSLLHDDIMDGSDLRRGQKTVHTMFGVSPSILAGDALMGLAFNSLAAIEGPANSEIVRRFSSAFLQLCEGQGFDILADEGLSPNEHETLVENKTARLIGASAAIGGLIGHGTSIEVNALEQFGLHIGMAYQAQDDLLDAVGSAEGTGKSVGLDKRNGRQTFLTTMTTRSSHGERVEMVRNFVADNIHLAFSYLHMLPQTRYRAMLETLTHSLIGREK